MDEGTTTTGSRAQSILIKRPRLTRILDESDARLLMLCAPAGYGKTTLAREWAETREGVVWYAGGPALADVAAFAAGLGGAFGGPSAVERIERIAGSGAPPRALARAVASAAEGAECSLLVLDDYHHALESDDSETFLAELLTLTKFRVLVTTRTRPAWITPRMLVYGEAFEVGIRELAFTSDEAYAVLGGTDRGRENVVSRAAGWPAVIGLAAMRGVSPNASASLGADELYEFFAEDLYRRMPIDLQHAVDVLALAGDADRPLAATLLGPDFERLVVCAADAGFLTRARADVLTIHPLLSGFLRTKMAERGADKLVRHVVGVLAEKMRWDECLAALERFPDDDLIISVLEPALPALLEAGRVATLTRWLALAQSRGVTHARVLLAEGEIAHREGNQAAAMTLGARAGEMLEGDEAARAYIAAARAAHLVNDDRAVTAYVDQATKATTNIARHRDALWIAFVCAVERPAGRAVKLLEQLRELGTDSADDALRLAFAAVLTGYDLDMSTHDAFATCERSAPLLAHAHEPLARTAFLNLYAHVAMRAGRYEESLALAEQQIAEASASGLKFAIAHGQINQAGALIGLRRFSRAKRILDPLVHHPTQRDDHIAANALLQLTKLRIGVADLPGARILLSCGIPEAANRGTKDELSAHHALVEAALGETVSDDVPEELWQCPARGLATLALAVAKVIHGEPRAHEAAVDALSGALRRGDADCVVTACRAVPALASVVSADTALATSLTDILMRSRDFDLGRRSGLKMPRELRRNENLSPRERDVYELLVQGRSNREIARALFISESTTKVHVRHIFEKLGVHSRAEAALLAPTLKDQA